MSRYQPDTGIAAVQWIMDRPLIMALAIIITIVYGYWHGVKR